MYTKGKRNKYFQGLYGILMTKVAQGELAFEGEITVAFLEKRASIPKGQLLLNEDLMRELGERFLTFLKRYQPLVMDKYERIEWDWHLHEERLHPCIRLRLPAPPDTNSQGETL